jgi:hypothetical protein
MTLSMVKGEKVRGIVIYLVSIPRKPKIDMSIELIVHTKGLKCR